VIVVVGTLVMLGGFAARSIEDTYGGTIPSELVERADGTWAVYDFLDERAEVYEIEEIDESVSVVYGFAEDTGDPIEVFRGAHDEAQAWKDAADAESRELVFEGPRDEALAWEQARTDAGKNMLIPNLIVVAGVVIILAGLALGWRRQPNAVR
jgi:hypothetical protein